MGALTIPDNGPVYLDSNCFIYSVERIEPYRALLEPVWTAARSKRISIVTSELTVMEVLIRPIAAGDGELETSFRSLLFKASEVRLAPISLSILERAARLRAGTSLRTPDALHAATAAEVSAQAMISNDKSLRGALKAPVVILSDHVG